MENMKVGQSGKKETGIFLLCYTLLFILLAAVFYGIFEANGKSMVKATDGVAQHLPTFCYIRDYLRSLFTEGVSALKMVDFSVGQGFDVIGTLNYYGFGDPTTLITLLFPDGKEELLYAAIIFFRMYLSGITFSVFCHQIGKKDKRSVLVGALLYAFCQFSVISGVKHPLFLNGPLYLPLLLVGVERILRKKGPVFLAVTVGLAFMSNYYFMYMNTIITGIYFLVRYFSEHRKSGIKGFGLHVGKIILAYIWGVAMAAVILFPAVYAFLNNAREIGSATVDLLYEPSYYRRALEGFVIGGKGAKNITGVLGVFAIIMMFVRRSKETRQLRILFWVVLAIFCLPFGGWMMNGFSYVTNRWTYVIGMIAALAAVFELPYLKDATYKQLGLVSGIYVMVLAGVYALDPTISKKQIFAMLVVLGMVWGIHFFGRRSYAKVAKGGIIAAACLSVLINVVVAYSPSYQNLVRGFQEKGAMDTTYSDLSLKALGQLRMRHSIVCRTLGLFVITLW